MCGYNVSSSCSSEWLMACRIAACHIVVPRGALNTQGTYLVIVAQPLASRDISYRFQDTSIRVTLVSKP